MKGVSKLLPVLFLTIPLAVKAVSSDKVPLMQEEVYTEMARPKPDFRPHSRAGFDLVEFQLQQDQDEWENTNVDWGVSLADGTSIPMIRYPNRSKVWYRIPPTTIIPPHTGENTSDDFMVKLQVRAKNPGIIGRSFIGRWLNINQNHIRFSVNCFFTRDAAYAVDPYPNYRPVIPVRAYLSVDEKYPVPVINLKLPLYGRLEEIVNHRAMIHEDPERSRVVASQESYQVMNEEEEFGSVDEFDFDELPVTDKSDSSAPTREEVQQTRQIEQLEQQWSLDDRLPTFIIWVAAGGAIVSPEYASEVASQAAEYVYSYSNTQ